MGFFSWNCRGCGESIKAPYSLPKEIAWQNKAVAIDPDGRIQTGEYDGYGSIADRLDDPTEIWHLKCWKEAGKPEHFEQASKYAEDQGFFYEFPSKEV